MFKLVISIMFVYAILILRDIAYCLNLEITDLKYIRKRIEKIENEVKEFNKQRNDRNVD